MISNVVVKIFKSVEVRIATCLVLQKANVRVPIDANETVLEIRELKNTT